MASSLEVDEWMEKKILFDAKAESDLPHQAAPRVNRS